MMNPVLLNMVTVVVHNPMVPLVESLHQSRDVFMTYWSIAHPNPILKLPIPAGYHFHSAKHWVPQKTLLIV